MPDLRRGRSILMELILLAVLIATGWLILEEIFSPQHPNG